VSITQQFNTTTSMGRLTLNVLLSFAQFEREVIGERVRDKIAASKKKGMWMGGMPPLGYDVQNRKLVVNEDEARTVVDIYRRYLALKSVHALRDELADAGIRSKRRTRLDGSGYGVQTLSRAALYLMLQNRIYRGEIRYQSHLAGSVARDGLSESLAGLSLQNQTRWGSWLTTRLRPRACRNQFQPWLKCSTHASDRAIQVVYFPDITIPLFVLKGELDPGFRTIG
jgi:Resolvase, N terminal domain/Recombinase